MRPLLRLLMLWLIALALPIDAARAASPQFLTRSTDRLDPSSPEPTRPRRAPPRVTRARPRIHARGRFQDEDSMTPSRPVARAALAAAALALLAGCAASRIDDNVAAAPAEVAARGGPDSAWLATDATQSARLPNPVFALERLAGGGAAGPVEVTRALTVPLLDLLLLPARAAQEGDAQRRLRLQLAADVLRAAGETRAAWVSAVAAEQSVRYAAWQAASTGVPAPTADPSEAARRPPTAAASCCAPPAPRSPPPPSRAPRWPGWYEPPPAASHAAHTPSNDVRVKAKKPGMGGMHMEH